jgi:hypothetical protein
MIIEFTREGKTYVCVLGPVHGTAPPKQLSIAFRACAFRAPVLLELAYIGPDPTRRVELYRPVEIASDEPAAPA